MLEQRKIRDERKNRVAKIENNNNIINNEHKKD